MATKPSDDKKSAKVVDDTKVETTNTQDENASVPNSALTNGERDGTNVRTPSVGEPVETSFDERTGVTQPFITEDGKQDNGLADLDQVDGAKGGSTREGNNTTVEDTKEAIRRGFVPASDQPDRPEEPVRNPVK